MVKRREVTGPLKDTHAKPPLHAEFDFDFLSFSLLLYTYTTLHTFTASTMSRNAQVEEVSDSDPEEVAPSDSLPSNTKESILPGAGVPPPGAMRQPPPEPQREIPKHYQCLYPVYFDKTRSRAEGRKVGSELAVENPLAREIVDAVQMLGLHVGLEPEKLHPKDWANPGRVRVLLKSDGKLVNPKIKNSALSNLGPWLKLQLSLTCRFRRTSPLHPRRAISQSKPND